MIAIVISIIAIVLSVISISFNIFKYTKSLPTLKFEFYNSDYSFPLQQNKMLFEKGIFSMEVLVTNSGNKEISIIDILPPVEQVSQIRVFKDNLKRPYFLLKKLKKFKPDQKEHIPLLNCSRLRIELLFKLKSETNQQSQETEWIWNKLYNEAFIIVTSDNKKYKLNTRKILQKRNKKPFGIFSTGQGKVGISNNTDGRISSPNLGVRFCRKIKK